MSDTWWIKEEQLDEDQKKVALLPPEGSYLIVGPPGSGKTNLLLLRAKYLVGYGIENLLVLVFTRMLKEFATAGMSSYGLPSDLVKTSFSWELEFLKEHGVHLELEGDFVERRHALLEGLQELIGKKNLQGYYPAILLDEAQDYWPEELAVFRHLGKHLFAAADTRQKIYSGRESVDYLKTIVDQVIPLRFHYRIGEPICKVADALIQSGPDAALYSTCMYHDDSRRPSVEAVACASFEEECEQLLARLRLQLKAYRNEPLGVLSPKRQSVRDFYQFLSGTDIGDLVAVQLESEHAPFDSGRLIQVSTVHSAKGAEFRAVHFVDCQSVSIFDYHRNINFTAITRAKTALTLYYVGSLQPYLRQALAALNPPSRRPGIGDLFVGKEQK